jgi:DNA-binding response OmpR family regulator
MTWPQYRRGECTAWGFKVKLSRLQAEVLSTLLVRFPFTVPINELIEATWPDDEPDHSKSNLHRLIGELRVKLGGFHIIGRRSFGYRLAQGRQHEA